MSIFPYIWAIDRAFSGDQSYKNFLGSCRRSLLRTRTIQRTILDTN